MSALSPDPASLKAARGLTTPAKWASAGRRGTELLWGECKGSGAEPYQVRGILSGEPAFKCTCPSRKFPCKHALGLLLLAAQNLGAVAEGEPPAWVAEWLQGREERAVKKAEKAQEKAEKPVDPEAQAKRLAQRENRVAKGIEELELWMRDLLREGLAEAQAKPYEFWDGMGARMVDAQAPGIARMVRELSDVLYTGTGWHERLLRRLGRLHLLLQAWQRLESFTPEEQADLRGAVGFTLKKEEVLANPGDTVQDHWLVLSSTQEPQEGLIMGRTWLLGRASGRLALLLAFAHPMSGSLEEVYIPGTVLDAELVFYPSALPQRALVRASKGVVQESVFLPPQVTETIGQAFDDYARALGRCPWLEAQPMTLRAVPVRTPDERQLLIDAERQALPVRADEEHFWKAIAGSAGRPALFFGTWNGEVFQALALLTEKPPAVVPITSAVLSGAKE